MENTTAIYYHENYYLLPDNCSSVQAFTEQLGTLPATVSLRILRENCDIPCDTVEKGLCIAPYFYSDYPLPVCDVIIEDLTDIYSVPVKLLTQQEYNQKLREVVLAYCPGCRRYGALKKSDESLNGHFEEISLDSTCFFRQESRTEPRIFLEYLSFLEEHFYDNNPLRMSAQEILDTISAYMNLKFSSGERGSKISEVHVSFKPDFIFQQLLGIIAEDIETLDFTRLHLLFDKAEYDTKSEIDRLLSTKSFPAFQKTCKKYGIALAKLEFDSGKTEKVLSSLEEVLSVYFARPLLTEDGSLYLLLLAEYDFMTALHFRTPFLESCHASVTVFDQYKVKKYKISFSMESSDISL